MLVVGGFIGLATAFSDRGERIEARLGMLMAMVGVWLLAPPRRFRAGAGALLLAGLLVAVGILGLAVGTRTWTEVGLELLMTTAGIRLFIAELRRARSSAEEPGGA
jgi:uncharacterized membrane protein YhhN